MSSSEHPSSERVLPPEPPTWSSGEDGDRAVYGADPMAQKPTANGPDIHGLLRRLGGGPVPEPPAPYTVAAAPAHARPPMTPAISAPRSIVQQPPPMQWQGPPQIPFPPALGPARTPSEVYEERLRRSGVAPAPIVAPTAPPPVEPLPLAIEAPSATAPTDATAVATAEPEGPSEPLHFRPVDPPEIPGFESVIMPEVQKQEQAPLNGIVGLSATAILMAVVLPPVGIALGIHCLRTIAEHPKDAHSVGRLPVLQSRIAIGLGATMTIMLLLLLLL